MAADEGKSVARRALDADRALKAARMRDKGFYWNEVAERLGYDSPADALSEVTEWTKSMELETEDLRALENRRLDMIRRMVHDVIDGLELDVPEKGLADPRAETIKAIDLLRRTTETSIKLNGLAAPQKIEVQDTTTRYELVGFDPEDLK